MSRRSLTPIVALLVASLTAGLAAVSAGAAPQPVAQAAFAKGQYVSKGKPPQVSFVVKRRRVVKVVTKLQHFCQAIGSGKWWFESQEFRPPGAFKIKPRRGGKGAFKGQRYVSRVGNYHNVRFQWGGRLNGRWARGWLKQMYSFYSYIDGTAYITVCALRTKWGAKRSNRFL